MPSSMEILLIKSSLSFIPILPFMFTIFLVSSTSTCSAHYLMSYNVMNYGATPGGVTDSTEAFVTSWDLVCKASQPATLYVPPGTFLLRSVQFRGPCKSKVTIFLLGKLLATSDYDVIGDNDTWLFFHYVDGLTIIGGGTLDAQGKGLWDCKLSGKNCPRGATSLQFSNSNNIEINGLTSMNSQLFHIVINICQNVKLEGVTVIAAGDSPNTDGIHVQQSSGVTILGANIATGDDCLSIGPGTNNLWVENVNCGPGHGISIGSLGKYSEEPGVQNVTVKLVTFSGSRNGVRIKSWGRPSTGFVKHVVFQDITVDNAEKPIIIDQNYCPGHKGCPGQASGIKISDITYKNIHGTSATKVAINLDCSETAPCTDIKLEDVKLTYKNTQAQASCTNADGTSSGIVLPSSCLAL